MAEVNRVDAGRGPVGGGEHVEPPVGPGHDAQFAQQRQMPVDHVTGESAPAHDLEHGQCLAFAEFAQEHAAVRVTQEVTGLFQRQRRGIGRSLCVAHKKSKLASEPVFSKQTDELEANRHVLAISRFDSCNSRSDGKDNRFAGGNGRFVVRTSRFSIGISRFDVGCCLFYFLKSTFYVWITRFLIGISQFYVGISRFYV